MKFPSGMDVVKKKFGLMVICCNLICFSSNAENLLDDKISQIIEEFSAEDSNEINSFDFNDFELRAARIKARIDHYYGAVGEVSAKCKSNAVSQASKIRLQSLEYLLQNAREMYEFRRITDYRPDVLNKFLTQLYSPKESRSPMEVLHQLNRVPALVDASISLLQDAIKEGVVIDEKTFIALQQQNACNQSHMESNIAALVNSTLTGDPGQLKETNESRKLFDEGNEMIESTIIPAYAKFRDFICDEYAKAVRSSVSFSAISMGREYYAALARASTTTTLTPEEIHDIGRREMERIKAEMDKIRSKEGFNGTLDQFIRHIQSQKQFYFDDVEEFKEAAMNAVKQVREKRRLVLRHGTKEASVSFFHRENIPLAGYYSPDNKVLFNTFNFDEVLRSEVLVVALHEGYPGHHSQSVYPVDIEKIRLKRSLSLWPSLKPAFTAYGEGWGLYSEALGEDMGLYKTNMQRFARYTYEMLRSVRLVIDTGVHHYGWTLEEAADFVRQHTFLPEDRANNEADRVRKMPAQMLGYKIGQMKMTALRARAEAALGDNFDLREFNHQVLRIGSVPLGVLEEHIDEWLLQLTNASKKPAASSRPTLFLITIIVLAIGC